MNNDSSGRVPYSRNAYSRAFVRTVLRLEGVAGMPSDVQLAGAMHTLRRYDVRIAAARAFDLADDSGWRTGRMPEDAAVRHAFVFVKFDSVLNSTLAQNTALHRWIKGGQH